MKSFGEKKTGIKIRTWINHAPQVHLHGGTQAQQGLGSDDRGKWTRIPQVDAGVELDEQLWQWQQREVTA